VLSFALFVSAGQVAVGGQGATGPTPANPTSSTPFEARFRAIRFPVVSGRVEQPRPLVVGRATIAPTAGTSVYVLAADGTRCGVLVDGPATLTYRVEDRFSVPVSRRNLKRVGGLKVVDSGGGLTLTGPLRAAAIWGWDLDVGTVAPHTGTDLPEWLRDWNEHSLGTNPARDMLQSAAHGEAGYRWAALRGTSDDFELDVDPRPISRTEVLLEAITFGRNVGPLSGRRSTASLVAQPIGQQWWDPIGTDFTTSETDLDVRNPADLQLNVRAKTRVESQRDGLRVLSFSLMAEQPADRGDEQGGPFAITTLTLDGAPASHVRVGWLLMVESPRPLKKGESVSLEVALSGEVLVRPEGDRYWRLGTTAWYPVAAFGGREWASFTMRVEAPAPFVPIAAGQIVKREQTPALTRVFTTMPGPMTMPTIVAGNYKTRTESTDGGRVHVSSYATDRGDQSRRLAGLINGARGCLENWLGVPYPFPDLEVIEVRAWGWGQAPPGVLFLTQEAFLSQAQAEGSGNVTSAGQVSRGINERIAHEVAHAWFPHVAKIGRAEDNWLSESFADYVSAVCLERMAADKGRGHFLFDRRLSDWKFQTRAAGDGASVYLASHLGGAEQDYPARLRVLYGKGPLVLHALRQELAKQAGSVEAGDRLFLTWIRAIVRNFTYKLLETRYLVAILNQITNANWQPWFERYVYGAEVPDLN
jgi:hypothetical protein